MTVNEKDQVATTKENVGEGGTTTTTTTANDLNDSCLQLLDISCCKQDVSNGGMMGGGGADVSLESDQDLNTTLTDTLQLRKNLFGETFDLLQIQQQQQQQPQQQQHQYPNNRTNVTTTTTTTTTSTAAVSSSSASSRRVSMTSQPVAVKIAHFEGRSAMAAPAHLTTAAAAAAPALDGEGHNSSAAESTVTTTTNPLSVYLRIRPMPSTTTKEPQQQQQAEEAVSLSSTIEIVPAATTMTNSNGTSAAEAQSTRTTTMTTTTTTTTIIRTHAPPTSNAYKVFREGNGAVGGYVPYNPGGAVPPVAVVKEYEFSAVFGPTTSQLDMYRHTVQPLLREVVHDGRSALVFCYGITNAGKTYTVTGPETALVPQQVNHHHNNFATTTTTTTTNNNNIYPHSSWGLVPRAMHELFIRTQQANLQSNTTNGVLQLRLYLSYFEIYNEQVYDLIPTKEEQEEDKNTNGHCGAKSTNTSSSHSVVDTTSTTAFRGLSSHLVPTVEDGLAYIARALKARRSGANHINSDSSRSHAICQLRIMKSYASNSSSSSNNNTSQQQHEQHPPQEDPFADLWIVDLAGSERSKRTGGIRQHEAAVINKSLMTLNRCLRLLRASTTLSSTSSSHNPTTGTKNNSSSIMGTSVVLPWRESKLTQLFAAHWMGPYAGRTTMIVNVNPAPSDFDETQHVLAYATLARAIRLTASRALVSATTTTTVGLGGGEYDRHGRRRKKTTTSTITAAAARKPTIAEQVVNIIRKLSPKRVLDSRKRAAGGVVSLAAAENPIRKKPRPGIPTRVETATVASLASSSLAATTMGSNTTRTAVTGGSMTGQLVVNTKTSDKEIRTMQMEVSVLRAENSMLQTKCRDLEEQVEAIEQDVRCEVAEEMESQMRMMREQYETTIECLKAQLQDPSDREVAEERVQQSARKLQVDRAERKINSLLDQVAECEDEMKRMRTEHEADLMRLTVSFEHELAQKELRLQEVQAVAAKLEFELAQVAAKVAADEERDDEVEDDHTCLSNRTEQDEEWANDDIDNDAPDHEDAQQEEEGNDVETDDNSDSSVSTQRVTHQEPDHEDEAADDVEIVDNSTSSISAPHPEPDHEEDLETDDNSDSSVSTQPASYPEDSAVQIIELLDDTIDSDATAEEEDTSSSMELTFQQENDDECSAKEICDVETGPSEHGSPAEQDSSAKAPATSSRRAPFASISNSKVCNSAGSFGPSTWLEPKKGVKKDPATGTFPRPRGRKPKDADYWDEQRGAWRLSVSE